MKILLLDYETYSPYPIKPGAYRYALPEDFALLLVSYLWIDLVDRTVTECKVHDFVEAGSQDFPAEIDNWIEGGGLVAGWSLFEWIITERVHPGKLSFDHYVDPSIWAAEEGYPLSLAGAGEALDCDVQKDPIGKKAIQKFCKPNGKGSKARRIMPDEDPDLWQGFVHYCRLDTILMSEIMLKLPPLDGAEWALWQMDLRMNHRGIRIDVDACMALKNLSSAIKLRLNEILTDVTGGEITAVGQVARIAQWCGTTSAGEPALRAALRKVGQLNLEQQKVAKIRLAGAKSSTAKIDAMMDSINPETHRSHGTLQFCGTKTKRWAGRIWQPHNLPRKSFKPDEFEQCLELAKDGNLQRFKQHYPDPMEAVSMMLRGLLIPADGCEFIIADYAAIEARIVAWYAGQEDVLQLYREDVDVYKEMAVAVYRKPMEQITDSERFIGKTLVLGSGYGLGWVRLKGDLTSKGIPTSEEQAKLYTRNYRRRFNKVVSWWQRIFGLFRWVLRGNDPTLTADGNKREPLKGGLRFSLHNGNDVCITLASGLRLWYRDCQFETRPAPWDESQDYEFITARNYGSDFARYDISHSILAENICSATAREIMARGMLRCEHHKYPVVMSVHDEVVLEVEQGFGSLEEVDRLLCEPLWFTQDLPLKTESMRSPRYRK